jgi:DNA replication and repair protein RecF
VHLFLQQIWLSQFKNYEQLDLQLSPGINLLHGPNGSGKTNLLDAIHYLALTKSHFLPQDKMAIRAGSDFFRIEGHFLKGVEPHKGILKYLPGQKKLDWDDRPITRLADHIGTVGMVFIAPDDLEVIDGYSSLRRKFMDVCLSQTIPDYIHQLTLYRKVLEQRNAYLKMTAVPDQSYIQVLDEKLVPAGHFIYDARKRFLEEWKPHFDRFYRSIGSSQEKIDIQYQSSLEKENLFHSLQQTLAIDTRNKTTSKGIHKDEIQLWINGQEVKYRASQGQKKTILVSLFLAQADYLQRHMDSTPLLLLDDIFDKLDPQRMEFLLETLMAMPHRQIFITDTTRERISRILQKIGHGASYFQVNQGAVTSTL